MAGGFRGYVVRPEGVATVSTAAMADKKTGKKKPPQGSGGTGGDGGGKGTSIKVRPAERALINQAAGARGQGVADLFASHDVRTFFTHLIVPAAEAAKKRLEERPEGSG